jgi:rod shape-determining protein MreC
MARVIDTRRSRVLFGSLILAHLIAISHQVDGGGGASLLERVVFSALSPFQRLAARAVSAVGHGWTGYVDLLSARRENERLVGEVRRLQSELQQREHLAQEAGRLRELLELRPILPLRTLVAEVLARDGQPWFRTLTVDKGQDDGVRMNASVVSPTGVVGRVIAVGPHASRIQLLVDRESGVGVLDQRSRVNAVVSGQVGFADSGASDLVMKYVPHQADIAVGDVMVTSGLDRIYPKGLVVGRIHAVGTAAGLFREGVLVTPSARFDELEVVLIAEGGGARE